MNDAALSLLPSGQLRVERGPVSLVIGARWEGQLRPDELRAAGRHALEVLEEVAAFLNLLRVETKRVRNRAVLPPAVRAMVASTSAFPDVYITPLAAVAGTVADAVADFLVARGATWVIANNGGDVALRLAPGEKATVGLVAALESSAPSARVEVTAADHIGGVVTSGTGGRSFTLGIADAVTVFAETASGADAAATILANQVDVDSPTVVRVLAEELYPETDLRGHRVTTWVGELTAEQVDAALERGTAAAQEAVRQGIIRGAVLFLRGRWRLVGWPGKDRVVWAASQ